MTHTQTTYTNRIALRAGKKGVRPAEVGALASVFEKSATELKQKLLKCKQTVQIATFNVRTLNRIGQLPELTASAVEHKIDIICIQEHRNTHTEDIKEPNKHKCPKTRKGTISISRNISKRTGRIHTKSDR